MKGPAGSRPVASIALALACFVVVAALALAACGGSSTTATTSPTATPGGGGSASPAETPGTTAVVQEFHGMLPVVSTDSLVTKRPYTTTTTSGGITRMRHAVWTYRQKSSDPRMGGVFHTVINVDQRKKDRSATLWGTSVLHNQYGAWVGTWTGGIATRGVERYLHWTMKGTGDYAGLAYQGNGSFVEAGQGFTSDIHVVFAGWIETTDGSPVPPAPGPGTTPANWTPIVALMKFTHTAYASGVWTFDVAASDARVGGHVEGTLDAGAARSDGSLDYGGHFALSNGGGSWNNVAMSALRGPGAIEHFQCLTWKGSGAYAGLTYHDFSHFMERRSYVPGDILVKSGWIEEAK